MAPETRQFHFTGRGSGIKIRLPHGALLENVAAGHSDLEFIEHGRGQVRQFHRIYPHLRTQAPAFENVIILVHIVDGKGTAAVPGQGGVLAGQVGDLNFGVYRVRLLLGIHNVHRQGRTRGAIWVCAVAAATGEASAGAVLHRIRQALTEPQLISFSE